MKVKSPRFGDCVAGAGDLLLWLLSVRRLARHKEDEGPMTKPKKPIPQLICDEKYWNHRAEEARTLGESIRHPECKRIMADIADSYVGLASLSKDFQKAAATPITVDQQKSGER